MDPGDASDLYGATTELDRAHFTNLMRQQQQHQAQHHIHDPRFHCIAEYGTTQEREQLFRPETLVRREDLLKKVECPMPPDISASTVPKGNTIVTLKGHVYESPKFGRGNSFPPSVYHDLEGGESEDRRGKLTN